jgi:two-component system, NarL family, sensor histidine kinase DegS
MSATGTGSLEELLRVAADQRDRLDRELTEIDLLIQQARMESARHDQKRAQSADRLESGSLASKAPEIREQVEQLITLTKRASLMQAQVDILEGKQKVLTRFRDSVGQLVEAFESMPLVSLTATGNGNSLPPELNRAVMTAQEDLRREIARQMHDGPAQSLTNIVLRAQIVERLMGRDPSMAQAEVTELVDMVQQTLESTKSFIFDVRPMVLDDLGLVPTLRRAARDRGRRAGIEVLFESVGSDRRLAVEVESAIFRILDDAIGGLLGVRPDQVRLRLDWTDDRLVAEVSAKDEQDGATEGVADADTPPQHAEVGADVPPALADMINQQRASSDAATAAAASARAQARALPEQVWNEIQQRAASVDLDVTLSPDGRTLKAELPLDR